MIQSDGVYQPISQFYAGKSIFITGGTGFLGKLFIEKILYSCPEIDKIYMLIREKKNMSPQQRILQMTEHVLFSRLREKRPDDLKKIIPIVGDIIAPQMGMRDDDQHKLIEEVSVVIHSAATVKFNEPLKAAMSINVGGTEKVLSLCQRMKQLQVLIHVSTAYTNTDKKVIEEIVYPPPAQLDEVYEFIKLYGDDDKQVAKILNGRPNTYTFTKALAETYVKDNHGDIPTIIIRPSTVTPAKNEPLEGWTDNWYGATGLLHLTAKGYLRCLYSSANNVLDIIPVDYVCNLIIVAAAKCNRSKDMVVLNSCSSSANPIMTRMLSDLYIKECLKDGSNDIPFPWVVLTRQMWLIHIITWLTLTVPAYIADMWMIITGKSTRFVKLQSKIVASRKALDFFSYNNWMMKSNGVRDLYSSLTSEDRELYPFDVVDIDWESYIHIYFMGVKKYLISKFN